MTLRARIVAVFGVLLVLVGAVLARHLEPGVSLEPLEVGDHIPALRFKPSGRAIRGHVLLLHGVTASKETLVPLGEALAAQGFECLAIDFPGHGESHELFRRKGLVPTAREAADFLGSSLDAVVGHSMGAYVAQEAIAAGALHPHRFISLGAEAGDVRLAGRWDEVVAGPATYRSPLSDHVLEPFDPLLIRRVVRTLAPDETMVRTAWLWRALGIACLGLGFLLLLGAALPRVWWSGFIALLGTALTYDRAFGLMWLNATPTFARFLGSAFLGGLAILALAAATWVTSRVPFLRKLPVSSVAVLAVAGAVPMVVALALVGQNFLAMCLGWSVLLLIGLGVLALTVELRTQSRWAAIVTTGGFFGYFLAQWIPVVR